MRKLIAIATGAAAVALLAGCGSYSEANHYNLPDSVMTNVHNLHWTRLDSPQNYPTIAHACYKGDGIYIDQDASNSVEVEPNDPACR